MYELITEDNNATTQSLTESVSCHEKQAMWPNPLPKIYAHEAHETMTNINIELNSMKKLKMLSNAISEYMISWGVYNLDGNTHVQYNPST